MTAQPDMTVQLDMTAQPDMTGPTGPQLRLIAGGLGAPGNVDGTGTAARFNHPAGVAMDGAGNLYVADALNSTIRKVVVATGVVTTLAGSAGLPGRNDGTGAAARFNQPWGVAVDGAGNLYVADSGNATIRKVVVATGVVTTLAGSAGGFNYPTGVAVDGAGNLYVADNGVSTIDKVVVATGVVTTLAGSAGTTGSSDGTGAAARFNQPWGVAIDGAGNLYVADSFNGTIRKVVVATGVVTTLAGSAGMHGSSDGTGAAASFSFPYGVAVDSAGNLYVADFRNYTIRKVVVATGVVTTLAGTAGMTGSSDGTGATARFSGPAGVAVDGAGNLYVTDTPNSTLRKVVVTTGVVTTLAGTVGMPGSSDGTGAAARFNSPEGVAVDGAGNLYVADFGNQTLRKVVVATGVVTTLAGTAGTAGGNDGTGTAARFFNPQGAAVDGVGNLYVTDSYTIRKVVVATGVVTTLAGTAGMSGSSDGTGAAARFNRPWGVAVDSAGNLYVADTDNYTLRQVVVATGVVTTLAGTAGMSGSSDGTGAAARFSGPEGVAVDGAGNLYVADTGNQTLRQVVVATGVVTTLAGSVGMTGSSDGTGSAALFKYPEGVAVDGAGNLYVADFGNSTIRKIVLQSGVVTTFLGVAGQVGVKLGPLPGGLNGPSGVAALPNGELFITDSSENVVLTAP
jgi:uncharacterized protein YjiK